MAEKITVNIDIDILLDKSSFNKFRQGLDSTKLIDPNSIDAARVLGTCNISKSFSCESVLEDLIKANPGSNANDLLLKPRTWTEAGTGIQKEAIYLGSTNIGGTTYVNLRGNNQDYRMSLDKFSAEDQLYVTKNEVLDTVETQKCKIIKELKNTTIDYYLAYVFDTSEKSLSISGTDPDDPDLASVPDPGGGHLELLTSKPEPSNKSAKGLTESDSTQGVEIFCDPCISIYNKLKYKDSILDGLVNSSQYIDEAFITAPFDWRTLGFSKNDPPTSYGGDPVGIGSNGNATIPVGKSDSGVIKPMARYAGFNNWLYTRYYGGNDYSLVPLQDGGQQKICIDLGKVFSVSVSIKEDKLLQKNIISVEVTGDDLYLGVDTSDVVSDETVAKFKKSTMAIDCCKEVQENSSRHYRVFNKINDSFGRLTNKSITVDQIIRAQGGLYSPEVVKALRPYAEPGADKSAICCNECFYCIVSTLCPGMGEIFNEMRKKETELRDHNANPSSINTITGKIDVGPQCVPYDKLSKSPIPKSFIDEDSLISNEE